VATCWSADWIAGAAARQFAGPPMRKVLAV